MIRTLLVLPASIALLLAPLVTVCHHGEAGHVELIGQCHAPDEKPSLKKSHGCCPHGHHHAQPQSGEPVAMTAPPLHHQKIGETDLAGPGSRSGFERLAAGTAVVIPGRVEPRLETSAFGFRGREPPPGPPLILLTRCLIL